MLVRACLAGDAGAYGVLVRKYSGPLFNAAYRITRNRDDASEATQAALVKAYEKLPTFDFAHRFFSWIYRIALNEALDVVGRRPRQADLEDAGAVATGDPENAYVESERSRLVQRALMELPPESRALLVLRHFQGLGYAELAEILGVPEKTIKSRLFTARQRLRDVMNRHGWLR
ncbi:MAG: RNA polymerase sigma factor [Acidobacteriota bacterium]